jgi:hypothetical protein
MNSFINKIIPIDILKSRQVVSTEEIGVEKTETTGVKEGVNRSFKIELSDGKSYLFKPKSGEHVSKWRYVPPKTLYQRERAAWLVAKQLGMEDMVPQVTINKFGSDIGSMQSWVDDVYHVSGDYMAFIEGLDEEQIMRAGIFDMVIGNVDRHGNNFMVSLEEL